jgi:hypothetical protein
MQYELVYKEMEDGLYPEQTPSLVQLRPKALM